MEAESTIWTEVGLQNCAVTFCVCFILFVIGLKFYRHIQNYCEPPKEEFSADSIFGQCKFPDCVRCRRHKDVLMRARTKLTYYDDDQNENAATSLSLLLKDVQSSYQKLTQDTRTDPSQSYDLLAPNPLIFRVRGIRTQPVWNIEEFPGLTLLSENLEQIQNEFSELLKEFGQTDNENTCWKVNETPSGRWAICHLVDQGVQTKAVTVCPVTWRTVSKLPGVMTDNLFGNVAFSVLEPGTRVAPHFGPTNIRIRCHLGVHVPTGCQLTVGGVSLQWGEGKMLCFDETFLHTAQHCRPPTSDDARVVLIIDLWHPDLNTEQRSLIDYAFSPTAVGNSNL